MIRVSPFLVVAAFGLLAAGVVTSQLALVYIAIAVGVVSLLTLVAGILRSRDEVFGPARPRAADHPAEPDGTSSPEIAVPAGSAAAAGAGSSAETSRGLSQERTGSPRAARSPGRDDDRDREELVYRAGADVEQRASGYRPGGRARESDGQDEDQTTGYGAGAYAWQRERDSGRRDHTSRPGGPPWGDRGRDAGTAPATGSGSPPRPGQPARPGTPPRPATPRFKPWAAQDWPLEDRREDERKPGGETRDRDRDRRGEPGGRDRRAAPWERDRADGQPAAGQRADDEHPDETRPFASAQPPAGPAEDSRYRPADFWRRPPAPESRPAGPGTEGPPTPGVPAGAGTPGPRTPDVPAETDDSAPSPRESAGGPVSVPAPTGADTTRAASGTDTGEDAPAAERAERAGPGEPAPAPEPAPAAGDATATVSSPVRPGEPLSSGEAESGEPAPGEPGPSGEPVPASDSAQPAEAAPSREGARPNESPGKETPAPESPAGEPAQSGEPASASEPAADDAAGASEPEEPAADAASAEEAPEGSGPADDTPGDAGTADQTVTVVPGVPRYHRSECILIRFMGDDDLQKMALEAAKEAGCTPCRACQEV